jgi:hypothetical protein
MYQGVVSRCAPISIPGVAYRPTCQYLRVIYLLVHFDLDAKSEREITGKHVLEESAVYTYM